MALYSTSVEYGLHCLLPLCAPEIHASSQDLADFQGISPAYLAKLFATLKRAGLVVALEGAGGGYRLARPPTEITVLDVVIALEGDKPLFQCNEIRGNCAVFDGQPPAWASKGLCSIHAVMVEEVTAWFGARRTTRARGATRTPFNRGEN